MKFVTAHLPPRRVRLLEVGCGTGELARSLMKLGHEVVAVDESEGSVEAARRLGVDARVARFPDFVDAPFDCVLFTRSLHHIRPLPGALGQAALLLRSSGLLLVEEFAFSEVNEHSAAWFYSLLRLLDACGVLLPAEGTFGRRLLDGAGALSLWREHTEGISSARAIWQAIADRFEVLEVKPAPYLYRYVAQMVAGDWGGAVVSRTLDLEKATGVNVEDFLIGRRFVARRAGKADR